MVLLLAINVTNNNVLGFVRLVLTKLLTDPTE